MFLNKHKKKNDSRKKNMLHGKYHLWALCHVLRKRYVVSFLQFFGSLTLSIADIAEPCLHTRHFLSGCPRWDPEIATKTMVGNFGVVDNHLRAAPAPSSTGRIRLRQCRTLSIIVTRTPTIAPSPNHTVAVAVIVHFLLRSPKRVNDISYKKNEKVPR